MWCGPTSLWETGGWVMGWPQGRLPAWGSLLKALICTMLFMTDNRRVFTSELLWWSRLFVFEHGAHTVLTAGLEGCYTAKCLSEEACRQTLPDIHNAGRESTRYVIVAELTYKTNILRKKCPRWKLVSISACNFLHCLLCCALKIWYLVLPCECIIVDSLLARSRFSISLSLSHCRMQELVILA